MLASVGDDGWLGMLIVSRKADVPDLAAFRIDFEDWVSSFARRDRKIIAALASGERTKTVAERFGLRVHPRSVERALQRRGKGGPAQLS